MIFDCPSTVSTKDGRTYMSQRCHKLDAALVQSSADLFARSHSRQLTTLQLLTLFYYN